MDCTRCASSGSCADRGRDHGGVLFPDQVGVPLGIVLPLLLIAATIMLGYTAYLQSHYPGLLGRIRMGPQNVSFRLHRTVLLTLGLLASLWTVSMPTILALKSPYHYQYSGIRLLARCNDKFLLLPGGWQPGRDSIFVIRDDDSIRADFISE